LSSEGFLRRGVTIEDLKRRGNSPEDRERLIILTIVGARIEEHDLRSQVGIGSSSHCLFGSEWRSDSISAVLVGLRLSSVQRLGGGEGSGMTGWVV
jgi:hypothetical protein